jgi:hypothetical protein
MEITRPVSEPVAMPSGRGGRLLRSGIRDRSARLTANGPFFGNERMMSQIADGSHVLPRSWLGAWHWPWSSCRTWPWPITTLCIRRHVTRSTRVGGGQAGNSPGPVGRPNSLGWDVGGGQCNGSFTVTRDSAFPSADGDGIELGMRAEQRSVGQVANVGGDYEVDPRRPAGDQGRDRRSQQSASPHGDLQRPLPNLADPPVRLADRWRSRSLRHHRGGRLDADIGQNHRDEAAESRNPTENGLQRPAGTRDLRDHRDPAATSCSAPRSRFW